MADTNETVFSIVRKRRELAAVPGEGRPPGRVSDVPWDGELADAMRERNIVVPEELVVAQLLEDMAGTARQR